ncbi:hypothetical protein B566_EDAN013622 [Ephemera danica]|nr:hypothetical protein B566_EDAN013622 [Ephemera danica]
MQLNAKALRDECPGDTQSPWPTECTQRQLVTSGGSYMISSRDDPRAREADTLEVVEQQTRLASEHRVPQTQDGHAVQEQKHVGTWAFHAEQHEAPALTSLAVTGFIWARYCLVIIPKNYSLCAINLFVGLTGLYQVSRAMLYQRSLRVLQFRTRKADTLEVIEQQTRLSSEHHVPQTQDGHAVQERKHVGTWAFHAEQHEAPDLTSLAVTGFIWARYCLVIIPKNYSLCAINLFVGLTGLYQVSRAMLYQRSLRSLMQSGSGAAYKMILKRNNATGKTTLAARLISKPRTCGGNRSDKN